MKNYPLSATVMHLPNVQINETVESDQELFEFFEEYTDLSVDELNTIVYEVFEEFNLIQIGKGIKKLVLSIKPKEKDK